MRRAALLAALAVLTLARPSHAGPTKTKAELRATYLRFLAGSRTPSELLRYATSSKQWRVVDPSNASPAPVHAGDHLVFINQGRTALFVIVGNAPLASAGARLIASHIDTPTPRLFLGKLTSGNEALLVAGAHGYLKGAHWIGRPLSLLGQVIKADGSQVNVELGGASDDFAFFIEARKGHDYSVIASSMPTGKKGLAQGFVEVLGKRYGINADDLRTSELYLVPKTPARTVGAEAMMVGGHGQDDRANSFLSWLAISEVARTPKYTAISWLADREESGSRGRGGARSHYLELVYSYLLRAQGNAEVSEADLMRAFAKTEALSADTPACINPNWPEVHEVKHGPLLGRGLAMFPGTGRGGKRGGSQAHAELVAKALGVFRSVNAPVQTAELGRVDEGGGGTVAKYLEHRGIDAVDIGVCVIGMHSPFEISSVQDFWWALRGFQRWFLAP